MPELRAKHRRILSLDRQDILALMASDFRAYGVDRFGRHGRILWIESVPVRRGIRRVASARESVTRADLLFVGLAYLPDSPAEMVPTDSERAEPRHLARVVRTLGNPEQAAMRATVQATRLLTSVSLTAISMGCEVEWILEGLDTKAIEDLLAVPADHRVIGLLAVRGMRCLGDPAGTVHTEPVPVDLNGFGGCFPGIRTQTGGDPSATL